MAGSAAVACAPATDRTATIRATANRRPPASEAPVVDALLFDERGFLLLGRTRRPARRGAAIDIIEGQFVLVGGHGHADRTALGAPPEQPFPGARPLPIPLVHAGHPDRKS